MASIPKPTETQLRQHALDRALQPDIVQGLNAQLLGNGNMEPKALADGILDIAGKFTEYLRGPEPVTAEAPQANLGLATTRDLILELLARGKTVHRSTPIAEDMASLMLTLERDMEALNYRTVDHA
jgi:hypothetical protein